VRHASAAHESPEAFAERVAAGTPDLAPVVNVFMQQAKGGSWEQHLVTFLTILTVILAYLQWQHPQASEPPPPAPSQAVAGADADKIAQEVFETLQNHPARPGGEVAKFVNESIRITDLATIGPVISDHEFENCLIHGPAILAPQQRTAITGCSMGGQLDEFLWILPQSSSGRVVGAIAVVNCIFSGCRFEGIGFTGPPDFLETFRRGLRAQR
jgi:hypothetical protein